MTGDSEIPDILGRRRHGHRRTADAGGRRLLAGGVAALVLGAAGAATAQAFAASLQNRQAVRSLRWTGSARPQWCPFGRAPSLELAAVDDDLAYQYEDGEQEGTVVQRARIEDLEAGREMKGIVNSVTSFGAFVDVGADKEGMVHVTQISEGYISDINEHVQRGQAVKVWVLGVRGERLALTMVDPAGDSRDAAGKVNLESFEGLESEWLEGTVTAITDFGVFCKVSPPDGGPAQQGLVHISRLTDKYVDHPSDIVEVGESVRVRVVSTENGKLTLSMRQELQKKPVSPYVEELESFKGLSPSEWIQGRVHHIVPFGCFVEVEPPNGGEVVMGLVHVSQIREGVVLDITKELELNQQVRVRVINVEPQNGRLALSMREFSEDDEAARGNPARRSR